MSILGLILLILLIMLLVGAMPLWPHSKDWGYAPSGVLTPLLMIHGELDNNQGTFPIQSERLYAAIKGNGGTARLVILPYEAHGYSARESVMHTLAEMIDWFDQYVKYAPPRAGTDKNQDDDAHGFNPWASCI